LILTTILVFQETLVKLPDIKFNENHFIGSEAVYADMQTWRSRTSFRTHQK
jgi:hypothetical protein